MAKLKGTTLSGSAVKTTLMNTMLSIMYMKFIMNQEKINGLSMKLLASGDDILIIATRDAMDVLESALPRYYSPDGLTRRAFGLGQILKGYDRHDTDFTFLSRAGKLLPSGNVNLVRLPERVILTGMATDALR